MTQTYAKIILCCPCVAIASKWKIVSTTRASKTHMDGELSNGTNASICVFACARVYLVRDWSIRLSYAVQLLRALTLFSLWQGYDICSMEHQSLFITYSKLSRIKENKFAAGPWNLFNIWGWSFESALCTSYVFISNFILDFVWNTPKINDSTFDKMCSDSWKEHNSIIKEIFAN